MKKAALFLLAIAAYLCWSLYPAPWLAWLVSVAGLFIVLLVMFEVKGLVRFLGTAFLCIGTGLHLLGGSDWTRMLQGFSYMMNILSLFALIPLIALPIRLGRYAERVQEMVAGRVRRTGTLYAVTVSLSYGLSSFMNIATIPMMVHLIRPSLDLFPIRRKERFLSRAITHGFAMPTLWTPVTPIVGIIVEMTGAAWESILVWAIPLSLMGLALDIAMGVFIARRRRKLGHGESFRESAAAKEGGAGGVGGDGGKGGADGDGVGDGGDVIGVEGVGKDDGAGDGGVGDGGGVGGTTGAGGAGNMGVGDTVGSNGTVGGNAGDTGGTGNGSGAAETARPSHPAQILLAILAFNGLVLALGRTTHFGFMLNVTLAVVPFAFCWSALLRRGGVFLRLCAETLPAQVLKMKDQFFVFLSAGYMITAMQASGLGHVLNEWIRGVESAVGANLFLLMIPLIPLGLAFLGFHPAVALALTAESLNPASLGISVEITAVAMLIGASTAFIMGPFNATIGLMAGLIGQPNYRISNWNAPFTVAFLALGMIMLLIANG